MRTQSRLAKTGLLVILLCLSVGTAFADLQIAGTATSAFYYGGINLGNTVGGLKYENTLPNGAFGPGQSPITLGTFSLDLAQAALYVNSFVLNLTFTQPGNAGTSFSADVVGLVVWNNGVAYINFDPNTKDIKYGNDGTGFNLTLNDVVLYNGHVTDTLVATFAPNPEPRSVILISTLLGGVLFLFRRRLGAAKS